MMTRMAYLKKVCDCFVFLSNLKGLSNFLFIIDGFIQEDHIEEEDEARVDERLHREVDRRREAIVEEDAEKLASEYREKYGRSTASKYRGDTGVVPQRLLLPSVQDPNIWGIRCKPGKEKELVRLILKKKINLQHTNTPLEIYSAFQRDGFTGYIYIEARKVSAVEFALKGFANVYFQNKILVPIKEYTDLLRVNKSKEQELTPGTYVRIKRGKYQGDLAIVENLSENGLEARLKIVPRLDYGKSAALNGENKRRPNANSAKNRPAPRLFSELDAVQNDQQYLVKRGPKSFLYHNEQYEDGFLIKDYKLTYLITENVMPTLEELQRFNNATEEGIDLTSLSQTLKQDRNNATFQNGDHIQVISGEQAGVTGRVISTQGDIVTIRASSGPLNGQVFDSPASNLRKKFMLGDHVRVVSGNYSGETGMIVHVEKDSVIILSDLSKTEVTVFARDLKEASDIGGANIIGDYELLDLVQLNAETVGCIIKIDRDSVGVLTQDGDIRNISPSAINMKIAGTNRSFATDKDGNEIRVGDTVKETHGKGRQGVILYIHRRYLFLQDRNTTENLGVFVATINNVTTIAVKGARVDTNKRGSFNSNSGPGSNNRWGQGGQRNNAVPIKQGGRDRIIGQFVTIGRGSQYKGLKGIVKDTTDEIARIELDSRGKMVSVDKTKLLFKGPSGQNISYTEFVVPRRLLHLTQPGGRGPDDRRGWNGDGGRTPAWGSSGGRTPGWADGGRTPAMRGGRTPNWNGSKTPAYGDGGRTPAWNAASRTPGWNAGSRTPGYGSSGNSGRSSTWDTGARTPGRMSTWDPNSSSASNSSRNGNDYGNDRSRSWYDSKTPAPINDMTAPTPGAASAPTPGFPATPGAISAPTPGGFQNDGYDTAPTPGVYDAKTPGAAPTPAPWNSSMDSETPGY